MMYKFKENWTCDGGGITIHKGVAIKEPFVETEDAVSIPGSTTFKDIPKSILEKVQPAVYAPKQRESKKKDIKAKSPKSR